MNTKKLTKEQKSCTCKTCRLACGHKAGWFKPSEINKLAKAMGLTNKQLFDKYLAVDWWEGGMDSDLDNIFVIAPAFKNGSSGIEYPGDPRGECVFFVKGKCQIHNQGKPYECAMYYHDLDNPGNIHMSIAKSWIKHQTMVKKLLGRDPKAKVWSSFLACFK
jgi:hypothetical protein